MEILVFVGVIAVAVIWTWLERKANSAINRHVFSRREYREQEALTDHTFTYPCQADWSVIRPLLDDSPLGDNLEITKDLDGAIQWRYSAFHLQTRSNGEFMAFFGIDPENHQAEFGFINWTTADGVVRHVDQMKQLKTWVQDVIEQANRIAVANQPEPTTQAPAPEASAAPVRPRIHVSVGDAGAAPATPVAPVSATAKAIPPVPQPPGPVPQTAPAPSPAQREFKFCTQCGARLKRDMTFCTQCGHSCQPTDTARR